MLNKIALKLISLVPFCFMWLLENLKFIGHSRGIGAGWLMTLIITRAITLYPL